MLQNIIYLEKTFKKSLDHSKFTQDIGFEPIISRLKLFQATNRHKILKTPVANGPHERFEWTIPYLTKEKNRRMESMKNDPIWRFITYSRQEIQ